jgi:hypothetical protein
MCTHGRLLHTARSHSAPCRRTSGKPVLDGWALSGHRFLSLRSALAVAIAVARKKKQGRGRPRVTQAVSVRLWPLQLKYLDEWRHGQLDQPDRSEAIRLLLIAFTLKARASGKHLVRRARLASSTTDFSAS